MMIVAPVYKPLHASWYLRRIRKYTHWIGSYSDRHSTEISKIDAFSPSKCIKFLSFCSHQHKTRELFDVHERNSCCTRICKTSFCKIPRGDNVISEFSDLGCVFTR